MRRNEYRSKLFVLFIALLAMLMVFTCECAEANGTSSPISALPYFNDSPRSNANETISKQVLTNGRINPLSLSGTFKFPASLKTIQDEAFEGTALVLADLSETFVEQIGERAFANIPTLVGIKIPEKTHFIAKTAFSGSNHVTLTGTPKGYTRTWAKENGLPFIPVATVTANIRTVQSASITARRSESLEGNLPIFHEETDEHKPAKQIIGDIKDNRCQEGVAYHIQGRAPPGYALSIKSIDMTA